MNALNNRLMAPQMGGHLPVIVWSEGNVRGFEREWVLELGFAPAARHFEQAFHGSPLIEGVLLLVGQIPFSNTFNRNGSQLDLFMVRIPLLAPSRGQTRIRQRNLLLAKSTVPVLIRLKKS